MASVKICGPSGMENGVIHLNKEPHQLLFRFRVSIRQTQSILGKKMKFGEKLLCLRAPRSTNFQIIALYSLGSRSR